MKLHTSLSLRESRALRPGEGQGGLRGRTVSPWSKTPSPAEGTDANRWSASDPPGSGRVILVKYALIAIFFSLFTSRLHAHEIRPALLEINERESGRYDVMWKVPMRGDMILGITPVFPEFMKPIGPSRDRRVPGAFVQNLALSTGGQSIVGETITIDGLSALQIDLLLRLTLADGTSNSAILRPSLTSFEITTQPGSAQLAWSYFLIGVKHILEGVEHLLFILGLLLIVRST